MSDRLTATDPHHWQPAPRVWAWLMDLIPASARVLDVGAGYLPFPRADVLVDFVRPDGATSKQEIVACDFGQEPLPFPDKSFDFVYCRQTIEDMPNPFHALAEIERVGKAGYIETPSPIAELCRGVDVCGSGSMAPWRGYNHHRWITWVQDGELCIVGKYPVIEYYDLFGELPLAEMLRNGPRDWATYYLWRDRINLRLLQSPLDFAMPDNYGSILARACQISVTATDAFWRDMGLAQRSAA